MLFVWVIVSYDLIRLTNYFFWDQDYVQLELAQTHCPMLT